MNYQNIARISKMSYPRRCDWCGQYIQKNEEYAILIPPRQKRNLCPSNKFIHFSELVQIHPSEGTEEEETKFWTAVGKRRKPKLILSEKQTRLADAFERVCFNKGYRQIIRSKQSGCVSCRKRGASDTLTYNPATDTVEYYNRRKRGLFDTFFEKEFSASVYNQIHKDDGKSDTYTAAEQISRITEEISKMFT